MGTAMQAKAVVCPQQQVSILSVLVTGTGTASVSGTCSFNVSLVDNGDGDYTLTFLQPFARVPQGVATAVTDNIYCKIGTTTVSTMQILTENLSGVATDAIFHLIVVGSNSIDQI